MFVLKWNVQNIKLKKILIKTEPIQANHNQICGLSGGTKIKGIKKKLKKS